MGRDTTAQRSMCRRCYFNPRAPHGARLAKAVQMCVTNYISIHAPRMGRDAARGIVAEVATDFNPRAPHGARQRIFGNKKRRAEFQSTRPAWGATNRPRRGDCGEPISIHAPRMGRDSQKLLELHRIRDFNPRAPHGARPSYPLKQAVKVLISIHAPRMGRDSLAAWLSSISTGFQSTRPAWGATRIVRYLFHLCLHYFNPRAPHGARPYRIFFVLFSSVFQSTRPAWGATGITNAGGGKHEYFNPRAPHGARPTTLEAVRCICLFQSTRPAWGATYAAKIGSSGKYAFQSTRPAWGATTGTRAALRARCISIHAPRMGRDVRLGDLMP